MDARRAVEVDEKRRAGRMGLVLRRTQLRPWRRLLLYCALTVAVGGLLLGLPQHRSRGQWHRNHHGMGVEEPEMRRRETEELDAKLDRLNATFVAALQEMAEVRRLRQHPLDDLHGSSEDDLATTPGRAAVDSSAPHPHPPPTAVSPMEERNGASPSSQADSGAVAMEANSNEHRRERVRSAFLHSWDGYKRFAWGCDELKPLSRRGKNWLAGPNASFGVSLLDGMTTAWVMGHKAEFEEAIQWARDHLSFDRDAEVSVFESTIRIVGSLLSAYELSGERHRWLVEKAEGLARRLLPAYNTSTGVPHASVNLRTQAHSNPAWAAGASALAEFGTLQLEMKTLSLHTGNPIFGRTAARVMDVIYNNLPPDGLAPTLLDPTTGRWTTDHVTLGALGDSYYEYLLKQWLITDRVEGRFREMFRRAATGIIARLVKRTPSGSVYLSRSKRRVTIPRMDHLACFAGGWFALGARTVRGPQEREWMDLAADLTETCFRMYNSSRTGLAPEVTDFRDGPVGSGRPAPAFYLLRPETVESLFYLWRFTREQKYRDWGWEIFRATEQWCRVPSGGYSGLADVNVVPPQKDDMMQSFWLAETLKYFYLLFAEDDALDLSQWVLNTEAHPLKIRRLNLSDGEVKDAAEPHRQPAESVGDGRPGSIHHDTAPDYLAAAVPGYFFRRDVDVSGCDLPTVSPGLGSPLDVLLIARECDRAPSCQGFTSAGQLKAAVDTVVHRPGCGLYVKVAVMRNRAHP